MSMSRQIDLNNEPVYDYEYTPSKARRRTFTSTHTLEEFRDRLIERIKKKIAEADPEKIEHIFLMTTDMDRYQVDIGYNSIKTEGLLSPGYMEIEKKDYKVQKLKKYKTSLRGIENMHELTEIERELFGAEYTEIV
jgi:hypothetical protein